MDILKKIKPAELSERDSLILTVGAITISLIVLYLLLSFFIFSPLAQEKVRYKKNAETLNELEKIKREFDVENGKYIKFISSLPPRGTDISSMVLRVARGAKIENNIGNMKPLSRKVDEFRELSLKFTVDAINTEELVDFLYKLENDRRFMFISKIDLEPRSSEGLRFLKATLNVKTYTEEKN